MTRHHFKFNIDISEWRKAAGFSADSFGDYKGQSWATYDNINIAASNKIHIMPDQPINTSVFEEAIVLSWNGVLTKEGMKEYRGNWINEGEVKPLIDFLNR